MPLRRLLLPVLLVAGFCATTLAIGPDAALLSDRFAKNPLESGWTFAGAPAEEAQWLHDAEDKAHCIGAKQGRWESPKFPVAPLQYYKVAFHAKGGETNYGHSWALVFFDAAGQEVSPGHEGSIEPSPTWKLNEFCVKAAFNAAQAMLRFQPREEEPLFIGSVLISPATSESVLAWADARYEALPQLRYYPPRNRFKHIPKTMQTLRAGGKLRVAVLGDETAADIGDSPWNLLVGRDYPAAKIEVITSILDPARSHAPSASNRELQRVVGFAPDLLILAGTDPRGIDDYRQCIRQIEAAGCHPEILLMTGALTPRIDEDKPWSLAIDFGGPGWRNQLLKFAIENKYEFLDIEGPFSQYESYAGKPAELWRRDDQRANDNARLILAKIVAQWFAPKAL